MKNTRYEKGSFTVVPNREALRGMKAADQAVFFWLCTYAGENGMCFPSRATLASDTGISGRSVFAAVSRLEECGLIRKVGPKKNGDRNQYQILIRESDEEPRHQLPRQILPSPRHQLPSPRQILPAKDNQEQYPTKIIAANAAPALPASPVETQKAGRKDPEEPLDLDGFVLACKSSPQRHIQVIGEWAEAEKPSFTKRGEWESFMRRNFRVAKRLAPFTNAQIEKAYHAMLQDIVHEKDGKKHGFITKYTLETVEKYLIP